MSNMQYAVLFKKRPQALPSITSFPYIPKIILYTFCSHKISKTSDSSTKTPLGGWFSFPTNSNSYGPALILDLGLAMPEQLCKSYFFKMLQRVGARTWYIVN